MFNKKILQIALLGLLGITYFKPGYSQNINTPLCIASDTGVGGPRYIETEFPLNGILSMERIQFTLRCRADNPIKIEPDNSGSAEAAAFAKSLQQYRPSQQAFFVTTSISTSEGNSSNTFNVLNNKEHKPGPSIHLPQLGPNKYHEITVTIEISVRLFYPSYTPPEPKPISPLYLPVLNVFQTKGTPVYAPYNVIVVTSVEKSPDPCIAPALDVDHPDTIDFGTLKKEDLNTTISNSFFFILRRPQTDSCSQPLYPIISFKATDPVINDEIQLRNGTILSLSAYKHSSHGEESFDQLKFNTPIRLGKIGLGEAIVLAVDAYLRKNPNKSIQAGPFSTTIIYHLEYR